MTVIWIDAQLSPAIATWITDTLGITAVTLRDLGLRDAEDLEIFETAKAQDAVIMTKDSDFEILTATLPEALRFLEAGENIVEISEE